MEGYTFVEDRPPPCFSEEELEILAERQRTAKASPLRKDTLLSFSLPSLYPKAVYSSSPRDEATTPTARHASQSLLKLLSDDSTKELSVRLVKGIQKGSGQPSQVWRGSLEVEGRKRKVVVKLFAEALLPLPRDIRDSGWPPASDIILGEAQGYLAFRAEQGRDVPICYGFYQFDAPWGEKVVGVILEDLSNITIPLSVFAANFLKTGDGFSSESGPDYNSDEEEDQFDGDEEDWEANENKAKEVAVRKATQLKHFIHELVKAHRRLQDIGFSLPIFRGDHILVLRSSTLDRPSFVFTSIQRTKAQREIESDPARTTGRDYRGRGEELLTGLVEDTFGTKVLIAWERMNLISFVY